MKYTLLFLLLGLISAELNAGVFTNDTNIQQDEAQAHKRWDATIYPNPNTGVFRLLVSENTNPLQVSVFNIIGEKVFEKNIRTDINTRIYLPEHIEKGLYVVQITDRTRGQVITRRMHVEKP